MGIIITPSSELGRELRKWEQHPTALALDEEGQMRPGNPYHYRPYPRMLYKATKKPSGKVVCVEPPPQAYEYLSMDQYERAVLETESRNRACSRIVHSDEDERKAMNEGWRSSPSDALEHFDACEQAIAQAAAEAAYASQRMSEKARAELKAADAATHEHVVDVAGGSKKRRGRKPKAVTGSGMVES